jgi:hypothetical protein
MLIDVKKNENTHADNVAQAPENPNITTDLFDELYGDRCFTTKSIDGRQVELKPGGRRVRLSLSNCKEFVELMYL